MSSADTSVVNVPAVPALDVPSRDPDSVQSRARQTPRSSRAADSGLRVFGDVGYGWFRAHHSFEAVLGTAGGVWVGGGAQYDFGRGYVVRGEIEHFHGTGQRVFVLDNMVFRLGTTDTTSITPLVVLGGYRVQRPHLALYAGAGAGVYLLRETSDLSDPSERVQRANAAYRAFVGMQWPIAKRYAAGVELQYSAVPGALSGGAAQLFHESDLGGLLVKGKLVFGLTHSRP